MFLNSASTETRGKMRVRITYDEMGTWPISRRIFDNLTEQQAIDQGRGGYSSMAKTADFMVGALIEVNENTGSSSTSNRSIEFHKFNLPWVLNGATEP
jgi:sialidase-1